MATEKIRSFSSKKALTKTELKEFRNYVSQLKQQGKIPGKAVNARYARPFNIRGGKTLAEIVNKHRSEVKPFIPAELKPKQPKQKLLPLKQPISMRDFPHRGKSLAEFFLQYEKDPVYAASIEAMKKPGEKWAFQIEDKSGIPASSVEVYENLDLMMGKFRWYHGVDALERQVNSIFNNGAKSRKLYNKIKLVRWNETATQWRREAEKNTRKRRAQAAKKNRRKK